MNYLLPYLTWARTHLDCLIRSAEEKFNHYIQYVDFPAFCLIYVIFLIWLLRKLNRPAIFRPKNKELVRIFFPI